MENNIPLVLIHKGNSVYLPASLLQLRYTNPLASIYLIGDAENSHYQSFVHHVRMDDYFLKAAAFKNIYRHFSTNGHDFELICLQRWFVLLEFMERNSLDKCIYLDSDILVYSDLGLVQPNFNQYGLTVVGISAHTNFVNSRQSLQEYCAFIWKAYESDMAETALAERYKKFRERHPLGGISDMTFLTEFRNTHPGVVGDLAEVHENSVFDITLDTVFGYEKDEKTGYKKIKWKESIPFAVQSGSGNLVRLHTLHFQGKCKREIYSYTTFSSASKWQMYYWLTLYYFGRVIRKIVK